MVSLDFSVTYFLPTAPRALGSIQPLLKMRTRNIPGGKGGRCVRLTTSLPSCAECHEIWEPKPPGTLWVTTFFLPRWGWVVNATPWTFFPPGMTRYPLKRRLDGTQGRSGQRRYKQRITRCCSRSNNCCNISFCAFTCRNWLTRKS